MNSSDQSSRARALDPSASFIVQAPAGSGKTELLIQRYLRLLAGVGQPETVIAITFTKKAAGEMRARVIEALRHAARGTEPDTPHERATYRLACDVLERNRQSDWRLLENPSRMRVQTIDALCAYITSQMPWLARFGAPPEITEKADDLYRTAARNTLRELADEEDRGIEGPISTLLLHLDNDFNQTERLVAQMLEKRDQWLRHAGSVRVREEIEQTLEELVRRPIEELHARFPPDVLQELVRAGDIEDAPGSRVEDRRAWQELGKLLLTKRGEWRKRRETKIGGHYLNRLERDPVILELLQEVSNLPPPRFDDSQWVVMEAVIEILPKAVAQLQLTFCDRGRVDFAELSIRASEALGELDAPSDLALSLGYRFEHLLIDEFQDTSYTQYELLRKLTAGWEPGDGRTLFLVGDPMQSIYRFRQAEVSLFLRARQEGIGVLTLEPLTLNANFRSTPPIVEWVNGTFQDLFPAVEHIESGAVAYSPSIPQRKEQETVNGATVHAFIGDSQAAEAERVLSLIQANPAKTIGILVRARSHLVSIVKELRERRILFQAIEIDALGERAIIQDLMALTFALLHLGDRVAWLAILRAPWCGLRIEDLHAIAAEDQRSTILELARTKTLSADGTKRLARILPILESALKQRGRDGLRNLVQHTWVRLGGPACAETSSALNDATAYFDLLEELEQAGDLGDFQALREQVKKLFAQPDSRADGRLQVMTIHKAKGLEFDVVILPGLGQKPRVEDQELLTWSEQEGKLLFAPISGAESKEENICKYLARLEQKKSDHETARLLYVAATRVRAELHLLGCAGLNEKSREMKPHSGSFLELLWPAVHKHFNAKAMEAPSVITAAVAQNRERLIRRVPENWTVPNPPPAVYWRRETLEPPPPIEITYDWVGDDLRHAGTVVHAYLQRIAREGLSSWDAHTIGANRATYRALLTQLGVSASGLAEACERVENGLRQALRDPRGQWVLGPHAEAECEYPIMGLIDGNVLNAVIDRTFVDETGVRWIIDYKTSSHAGGDVESFLDNERTRYQEQLERYSRLLVQSESRPIRLALYFPLLNGWREWAAPTMKRRQASLFEEDQ